MTNSPNTPPRIQPTVGRVVLFHLGRETDRLNMNFVTAANDTYAAIVAYVHSPTTVNLTVSDANGMPWGRTIVPLVHDDEERPAGAWCEWMPYQKDQAAKTERAENASRDVVHAIGQRLQDALAKDPAAFSREQLETIFGLKPVQPATEPDQAGDIVSAASLGASHF